MGSSKSKKANDPSDVQHSFSKFDEIPATTIDGDEITMGKISAGKVCIVVNVAHK